ncbi:MAG TPA: Holliday junction resolvase RecU [Candidatus Enterococcus stercoravium]|nr:Holliday junction resolvase RecU [Candidatus Enterococcus stercoravium]
MVFNYPDGRSFQNAPTPKDNQVTKEKQISQQSTSKLKTTGTKPFTTTKGSASTVNFGNRGMRFEEAINESNTYYLTHKMAVVHKKPTPIQIVKVDYPRRSAAMIKEAYFKEASTTDYNGVYQGRYLDFEAKETKNKASFPFKNFHAHQITHMKACLEQGGLCFVLLWFSSLERCFFLDSRTLIAHWDQQKANGKKSLPLTTIEVEGIEITRKIAPRIPYLEAVDHYLKKEAL